jgi:hypothetical protein
MRIVPGSFVEITMKREGMKGQRLYNLHEAERGKSDESPTWLQTFANARTIQYLRERFLTVPKFTLIFKSPHDVIKDANPPLAPIFHKHPKHSH